MHSQDEMPLLWQIIRVGLGENHGLRAEIADLRARVEAALDYMDHIDSTDDAARVVRRIAMVLRGEGGE